MWLKTKGEWIYILNKKIGNYTKEILRLVEIALATLIIVFTIVLIKYKPIYKVTISGEEVGYINNKNEFEKIVNDEILNPKDTNIAFVDIDAMPQYDLIFIEKEQETSEEEIFSKIKEMAEVTYRMYSITVNNENMTYVNSKEEAEEVINKIKEENANKIDQINIGMQEIYTKDKEQTMNTVEVASAVTTTEKRVTRILENTFDGIYFSVKPVSGTITSRFGANESVRDHTHMGIDISAPNGTAIKAAADGKVKFAGWMGGYGNLVIISHGNGIETYYGHCSKLYVSEGEEVTAGDKIAAVGSTGYSTGNHLHFEIRKNGNQVNPQKYLYK